MDNKFYKSILVFLIVLFVIFSAKPSLFYKDNKSLKEFGIGKNKSLFTPLHVALSVSVVFYALTCV